METPDERRERIDEARRDQADLNREIGQEYANLAIRPSAAKEWRAFQGALRQGVEDGVYPSCRNKPERYQDYDAFDVPSPARAAMACAACPFLEECREFAEAERPGWGIWGGKVYGRDLGDKERREFLREQAAKNRGKEEQ